MERYSMFLGGKNQYCGNDYTTKCNLQIQCVPSKLSMAFFTELEQKISQFIWKYKDSKWPKQSWERMELKESTFLTSDYSTKGQSVPANKKPPHFHYWLQFTDWFLFQNLPLHPNVFPLLLCMSQSDSISNILDSKILDIISSIYTGAAWHNLNLSIHHLD